MLFISQGSTSNHWGNRIEIKVHALFQEYRIHLFILAPDSCSDSNGTQSSPLELRSYSSVGGFAKLSPSFKFPCTAPSILEEGFNSTKVGLPKQYMYQGHRKVTCIPCDNISPFSNL